MFRLKQPQQDSRLEVRGLYQVHEGSEWINKPLPTSLVDRLFERVALQLQAMHRSTGVTTGQGAMPSVSANKDIQQPAATNPQAGRSDMAPSPGLFEASPEQVYQAALRALNGIGAPLDRMDAEQGIITTAWIQKGEVKKKGWMDKFFGMFGGEDEEEEDGGDKADRPAAQTEQPYRLRLHLQVLELAPGKTNLLIDGKYQIHDGEKWIDQPEFPARIRNEVYELTVRELAATE